MLSPLLLYHQKMSSTCLNSPPILFLSINSQKILTNMFFFFSPKTVFSKKWAQGVLRLLRNKMGRNISKWITVLLNEISSLLLVHHRTKYAIDEIWLHHFCLGHPHFCLLQTLFPSLFIGLDVSIFRCEVCEISDLHLFLFPVSKYSRLFHLSWFILMWGGLIRFQIVLGLDGLYLSLILHQLNLRLTLKRKSEIRDYRSVVS